MWRKVIALVSASVFLTACSTATIEDLSSDAIKRGFTVVPNSYRSPEGDTHAQVGVLVGSCTGTFSKPNADAYAYLTVYNPESGVTIIDQLREPTLAGVMSAPPAMTACQPKDASTTPAPTATTAR